MSDAPSALVTIDGGIYRQFDQFVAGLELAQRPTLAEMIDTCDRIGWRIGSSQRALVEGGMRQGFHAGEARDCLNLRKAQDTLSLILDCEPEFRAMVRRAHQRRWRG